jgi:hypothetical protein
MAGQGFDPKPKSVRYDACDFQRDDLEVLQRHKLA